MKLNSALGIQVKISFHQAHGILQIKQTDFKLTECSAIKKKLDRRGQFLWTVAEDSNFVILPMHRVDAFVLQHAFGVFLVDKQLYTKALETDNLYTCFTRKQEVLH